MSTLGTIIAIAVATTIVLPVVVFYSVKLGTFAYYLGRQRAKEYHERDDYEPRSR